MHLVEPDRLHVPGETVLGFVRAQSAEPWRARRIVIECRFRVADAMHGQRVVHRVVVTRDVDLPAGTQEIPFRFLAPDGPAAVGGRSVRAEWFLAARADIPWEIDPVAETPIRIAGTHIRERKESDAPVVLFGAVLLYAIPAMILAMSITMERAGDDGARLEPWQKALCAGPPWLLATLFVAVVLANVVARAAIGAWVRVEPAEAHPGSALSAHVHLEPRFFGCRISRVEVRLLGTETTRKDGEPAILVAHESRVAFEEPFRLTRGAAWSRVFHLQIPANAQPTFSDGQSTESVDWELQLRVGVARWPDWMRQIPLRVTRP